MKTNQAQDVRADDAPDIAGEDALRKLRLFDKKHVRPILKSPQ